MKKIKIQCHKHGEVEYDAVEDMGKVVTMYCPKCEDEARNPQRHPDSPYPKQGDYPSVLKHCGRGD